MYILYVILISRPLSASLSKGYYEQLLKVAQQKFSQSATANPSISQFGDTPAPVAIIQTIPDATVKSSDNPRSTQQTAVTDTSPITANNQPKQTIATDKPPEITTTVKNYIKQTNTTSKSTNSTISNSAQKVQTLQTAANQTVPKIISLEEPSEPSSLICNNTHKIALVIYTTADSSLYKKAISTMTCYASRQNYSLIWLKHDSMAQYPNCSRFQRVGHDFVYASSGLAKMW